ncbi:MAG TPA: crosslink repair DNA glycosylase YcaQ family protein [Longimicrobiales bacterium]|nr:crosslink repair DNA glycosylase YcaQ family protein [Longimicrobiales bacterium]
MTEVLRLTQSAARHLHLHAQGLDRRPRRRAVKADVLAAIRRMGVLQIDTISVVARSPYLVLFSRLGAFNGAWLDELLAEGALFEYWAHEASFLPIEDYALVRHRMLAPERMGWKYRAEWVKEHRHELDRVLEHVRERGPSRSADFERRNGAASGWWEWKPEKRALEALFTSGHLMVARRQAFQRVYDLRERVHATWSDDALPSLREMERQLILRSVRALGIATARWIPDYYRMPKRETPLRVREMAAAGDLVEVHVDGWKDIAYIHPDEVDTARLAAAGRLKPALTTLLSPFDPVVWDRARARAMFGFDYRIECYTPAPKRQYGYYVLPVLRRGALIGRLDAKAHRRDGTFEVKSLHLEEGVRVSDALLRDVMAAIIDAAKWHDTPHVVIRRTAPRGIRRALLQHMP